MKRPILSASNLAAAALCAGKPNAEKPFSDKTSDYAERGTDLHRYFQTDLSRAALSPEDREFMEYSDKLSAQFLEEFRNANGIAADEPCQRENEVSLDGIVPGHPDAIYSWRDGELIAILDLKTGPVEVDSADENEQLADYSALAWERRQFAIAAVCIVQPGCFGKHTSSAIYRAEQMPGLLDYIASIHASTLPADAPRVAGEKQCRFCRAKAVCPTYGAQIEVLDGLPLAVQTLDNGRLIALKRAIQFAAQIKESVDDELRERSKAGTIEGVSLQSTGSVRELFDPTNAFLTLRAYLKEEGFGDLTAEAFDGCRKLVWGSIEALVHNITGTSKKKSDEIVKSVLAPFTVETPKSMAVKIDKPKALK